MGIIRGALLNLREGYQQCMGLLWCPVVCMRWVCHAGIAVLAMDEEHLPGAISNIMLFVHERHGGAWLLVAEMHMHCIVWCPPSGPVSSCLCSH